ncbi:MAG: hypothetical protein H7A32_00630 [Deltaproteobacteria bacterium]|nr:hypothetical protein [Deltaproteobacteria bacterium]
MPGETTINYQTIQVAYALMSDDQIVNQLLDPQHETNFKTYFSDRGIGEADLMSTLTEFSGILSGLSACEAEVAISPEAAKAAAAFLQLTQIVVGDASSNLLTQALDRAQVSVEDISSFAALENPFSQLAEANNKSGRVESRTGSLRRRSAAFVSDARVWMETRQASPLAKTPRSQRMKAAVQKVERAALSWAEISESPQDLEGYIKGALGHQMEKDGIVLTLVRGTYEGTSRQNAEDKRNIYFEMLNQIDALPTPAGLFAFIPIELELKNDRKALILVSSVSTDPLVRVYESIHWQTLFEVLAPIRSQLKMANYSVSPDFKEALAHLDSKRAGLIMDQVSLLQLSIKDLKAALVLARHCAGFNSAHQEMLRRAVVALETLIEIREADLSRGDAAEQVKTTYAKHAEKLKSTKEVALSPLETAAVESFLTIHRSQGKAAEKWRALATGLAKAGWGNVDAILYEIEHVSDGRIKDLMERYGFREYVNVRLVDLRVIKEIPRNRKPAPREETFNAKRK